MREALMKSRMRSFETSKPVKNQRRTAAFTTERQQTANRTNALRHGLNLLVPSDPALAPQIEAIARKIAGPDADAELLEDARRIS